MLIKNEQVQNVQCKNEIILTRLDLKENISSEIYFPCETGKLYMHTVGSVYI